jgi:hypothetical protein
VLTGKVSWLKDIPLLGLSSWTLADAIRAANLVPSYVIPWAFLGVGIRHRQVWES